MRELLNVHDDQEKPRYEFIPTGGKIPGEELVAFTNRVLESIKSKWRVDHLEDAGNGLLLALKHVAK